MSTPPEPVTVSLSKLEDGSLPFETLESAFGPSSLGILLVKDLPPSYPLLRHRLLSYASYLANLPSEELEALTLPSTHYLTGWSHGREALKPGHFDTLKGSFYANCTFYPTSPPTQPPLHPKDEEVPNIWPPSTLLPDFRAIFESLCTLIIDVAILVARSCDRYASAKIAGYEPGYLERVVRTSRTTKARLLHYFPPPPLTNPETDGQEEEPEAIDDSWCATHLDHGCLTGLTSALYVDEARHPPHIPPSASSLSSSSSQQKDTTRTPPPLLPALKSPPSASTGLYIRSRTATVTKIQIPEDSLAFQTGEALQLITRGEFRAVPHFVRVGGEGNGGRVARNTLAVFTQPNVGEVVDRERGLTFGEFAKEVAGRFG